MILEAAFLLACAPGVAPATIEAIVAVESGGDPLAIHVNGVVADRGPRPRNAAEAARLALEYIGQGHSVDLGLMQVNSGNLEWLGTNVTAMFEPCQNIAAGATVLSRAYDVAVLRHGEGQGALLAALSAYNTGSLRAGFENGYVARYTGQGRPRARDPYTAGTAVRFAVAGGYWDEIKEAADDGTEER